MLLQACMIGLITFIGKADYWIGTAMVGRPLVLGALVGIALGDMSLGVQIGLSLELIFMGMQAIGASIPPDMIVGSVLGTAFAITSGSGTETAITIAFPAAVLSAFVVNFFYGVLTPLMARWADKSAVEGNAKGIELVHITNGFLFDLIFAIIAGFAFYAGGPAVESILNAIPESIITGLSVAVGMMPALGFALLLDMIVSKKTAVFFFAGFLLSAYFELPVLGVVAFSLVLLAIMYAYSETFGQPETAGGSDDEF